MKCNYKGQYQAHKKKDTRTEEQKRADKEALKKAIKGLFSLNGVVGKGYE